MAKKTLYILLTFLIFQSCAVFKGEKTEEVPPIEKNYQRILKEGQNLTPRQERKLEGMVAKILDYRKERNMIESTGVKSKRNIRKYRSLERKEYKMQRKIKHFHKKKNLDNQDRKVKRRLIQHRRESDRKMKHSRKPPFYKLWFNKN